MGGPPLGKVNPRKSAARAGGTWDGGAATINRHVWEELLVVQGTWREIICCGQRKMLEENNPDIITSCFSVSQTFCKEHVLVLQSEKVPFSVPS